MIELTGACSPLENLLCVCVVIYWSFSLVFPESDSADETLQGARDW